MTGELLTADGLFRCPQAECAKTWTAVTPADGRIPILRGVDNAYGCPGSRRQYTTGRLLQSHYCSMRNERHCGKMCIATPKNMLLPADLQEFRQHAQGHAGKSPGFGLKRSQRILGRKRCWFSAEVSLHTISSCLISLTCGSGRRHKQHRRILRQGEGNKL